ncbi:MAG: hypothetical protein HY717_20015 [Planctomycetes bacterium]|nr:hypothetical protein [Planctomycetota bacterium]
MKNLIIVIALAAGGFLVYKFAFASSSAYKTYEKFANALLYDRWSEARELASGEDVIDMIEQKEAAPRIIGHQTYRNIVGIIHWGPVRSVQSEVTSPDGKKVTLKVIQEERRGPNTMAPVGPPTVRHNQDVVLALTGDGWRVESFEEEIEPLGDR